MWCFIVPCLLPINACLHRCTPAAHLPLRRALVVIVVAPVIQIALQFFTRAIYFAPERDLVKLLPNNLTEAFTGAAIGLRMAHCRLRMHHSKSSDSCFRGFPHSAEQIEFLANAGLIPHDNLCSDASSPPTIYSIYT